MNRKQNIQMTKQTFRRTCFICIAIFPILAYASENSRDAAPQRPMDAAFLSFRPTDYYTTAVPALSEAGYTADSSFFAHWRIKTNLLYDAALMPSIEVEYRFNPQWSAAIEGNMAWWHKNRTNKCYQLATIIPEARYWFKSQGNRRGHYAGIMFGGGWYDLSDGKHGYRGEGIMAGVTYGYLFPVGKRFAFEAAIGVGYLHAWHDEYLPVDRHHVYQQSSTLGYFGPIKLRFAWTFTMGN